jgi:hypothetical protein
MIFILSNPTPPGHTALPDPLADGLAPGDDSLRPTAPLATRLRAHATRIQSMRRKAPALMAVTGTATDASNSAGALLMRVLSALPDGERRKNPRLVINANVFHDRRPKEPVGMTHNISSDGMLLSFHELGPDIIQFLALGGILTVEGLGTVTARMTRLEENAAFLAFEGPLDEKFDAALRALTCRMQQRHAPYLALSGLLAEQMQNGLVGQIINGDVRLEDVLIDPSGAGATKPLPPQCVAALDAILQSEIETLGSVSCVMALQHEGISICEVWCEHHANYPETSLNLAMFRAKQPEQTLLFGVAASHGQALKLSHADQASLAFAARISPVPAVQIMSLAATDGDAEIHHMASSPVYVLGRRWGAAAVIYQLLPKMAEMPDAL